MARKPLVNTANGGTPSFVDLLDFEKPTNVTIREIFIEVNSSQHGTVTIGTALSNTFVVNNYGANVEYLLVGGGGAGGKVQGSSQLADAATIMSGGGGAGGVLHGTISAGTFGSASSVIVGKGGSAGSPAGDNGGETFIINSSGGTVLIAGGGGGGGGMSSEIATLADATAASLGRDGTGGSSGGRALFDKAGAPPGSGGAGGGAASSGNWARSLTTQTTASHPLVGTKGLGNFGGDPGGAVSSSEPGLGVTIMGYQVAGGGPGGADFAVSATSLALYGSSYGIPSIGGYTTSVNIDSKYGSGGRGGYSDPNDPNSWPRGVGGDGVAVFRYLDTQKNNAEVWKRTDLTSVAPNGANEIKATAANGGTIIALTRGSTPTLLRTTNYGASWSTVALPASPGATESAVYGGSLFVIGMANKIFASSDGSAWSTASLNAGTTGPYQVAYGNGVFIAAGLNGRVFTSPNGTAWATAATATTAGTFNPIWAAYGTTQYGHTFIAGWEQNVSADRYMRFSNDNIVGANSSAAAWSNFVQPTAGTIEHVAYGNGKFWGVFGTSGTAAALRYTDGTAWTAVGGGTAAWTTGTVSYTGATANALNQSGVPISNARSQTSIAYSNGTMFVAAGPYFVLSKNEAATWEPRNATGFKTVSHNGSFTGDRLTGSPFIFDIRPLDNGKVLLAGGTVADASKYNIVVSISEP